MNTFLFGFLYYYLFEIIKIIIVYLAEWQQYTTKQSRRHIPIWWRNSENS